MFSKVKFLLVFAVVFSFVSSVALAYTSMNVRSGQFSQCFECTLQNARQSGSVTIAMHPANNKIKNYTVRMEDENGRYIWGEDGAISWSGTRTFRLGNDHRVYRIFIMSNGGSGYCAAANVTKTSNVSVRVR